VNGEARETTLGCCGEKNFVRFVSFVVQKIKVGGNLSFVGLVIVEEK
jgi:hypothetical protein